MREILFRGKRVSDGEWVYGNYGFNDTFTDENHYIFQNEAWDFFVDHETVGQFTGLTDKNGNRIFEGDIVLFDYIGKNRGVNGKAVVDFNNGKFGVFWGWHNEFVSLDGFANSTSEVIGNIHDNPELLET